MMAETAPTYAIRTPQGLVPEMAIDAAEFEKYPLGARVRVKITNPRSRPHHRKYWAILAGWVKATDAAYSADTLHTAIKLKLGYTDQIKMAGVVKEVPKSIDFNSMDQAEFNEFYERAMELLARTGGFDPEEVLT